MRHKRFTLLNPTKSARSNLAGIKLGALLMMSLGLTGLQAQTVYVKESSGTQNAYTFNNIQKMSFSAGNLKIAKTDNSSWFYALDDLRSLSFSKTTNDFQEALSDQSQMLSVYPNPVSNTLNIDLTRIANAEGTLSILSFDGKTMLSRQINNEGVLSFDISHLHAGIYLCYYRSATEVKTVKIIKSNNR